MMEKALESENSQTHKIKILSTWAGIALLIFGLGFLLNKQDGLDFLPHSQTFQLHFLMSLIHRA
jgi:hypothetical protein